MNQSPAWTGAAWATSGNGHIPIFSQTENRSIFAEFIVGVALGFVDKPRVEWDAADLGYRGHKIEVKSSVDCQGWHQEKSSTIRFGVGKAVVWNPATGKYEGEPTRCADVYVFCHYPEQDKTNANVLNVPAWDFYVISTEALNREFGETKSLTLGAVRRIGEMCKFNELRATVDRVTSRALRRHPPFCIECRTTW